MELTIYLFLFGIITFTNGKPTSDETSFLIASETELQSLLKSLYNQGKFDIAFSHREDGPSIHHEDSARFTPHENRHHHHHDSSDESRSRGHKDHHGSSHKHTNVEEHPSLTNIQTLNLFYRKKPASGPKFGDSKSNDDSDIESLLGLKKHVGRSVNNDVDEILGFLKELDDNLEDNRCEGDRCSKLNRIHDKDCIGDRCENKIGMGDNRNCQGASCSQGRSDNVCRGDRCEKSRSENCIGDRCERTQDNRDDDADCIGDRCARSKSSSDKILRCSGDRCGVDDRIACVGERCGRLDDDDDSKGSLRCIGDRCDDRACIGEACGRMIVMDDDDVDDNDNNNLLRCMGENCGRSDDRADCVGDRCGRDMEDDELNVLRCSGDGCGGNDLRNRRLPRGDDHIKQLLQRHQPVANKIKINDELDAIVVDITDLEKTLERPRANKINDNQQATLQLIENVELDNLLDDNRDGVNSNKPIEAIVVDLSKGRNDLSKELKGLVTDLQMPLKSQNRMKFKPIRNIAPRPRGESKILSHNEENNNVYVPRWLLDEVALKTSIKTNLRDPIEPAISSALPLTSKQKEMLLKAISNKSNKAFPPRIFRRNTEDIGVPFHLEIQGLGQVNP